MKLIRYLIACLMTFSVISVPIVVKAKPPHPAGTVEAKNLPSNLWGTWRVSGCVKAGKSLTVKGMSVRLGSALWHVTGVQLSQDNLVVATIASGDQATFKSGKVVFRRESGTGNLVLEGSIQGTFRRSCP